MRYLSLFSGIEAATAAWEPLGWGCVGFAEIDNFPSKVLAHRYPKVRNFGDVTELTELDIMMLGHVDVVIFGSPCQDLSLAGKRKGLAGERSGLFHTAMRIVGWLQEHCGLRFALWENVYGAFSSNDGRDFAVVLGEMAGIDDVAAEVPPQGRDKKGRIKWGNEGAIVGSKAMVEWATLDAQWFGVAQRRRRVFALADFGDWTRRAPVLLECESMRGDSAPQRGAREEVAGTLTARLGEGVQGQDAYSGLLRPVMTFNRQSAAHYDDDDVASTISARDFKCASDLVVHPAVAHTLRAEGFDASEDGTGRGTPLIAFHHNAQPAQMNFDLHTTASLTCSQFAAIAFSCKDYGGDASSEVAPTMRAMGHGQSHANAGGKLAVLMHDVDWKVRRLTPLECERLQGFDDNWTAISKAKDGPRYKALGNSMAVPVINWIGRSIEMATMEFWQ